MLIMQLHKKVAAKERDELVQNINITSFILFLGISLKCEIQFDDLCMKCSQINFSLLIFKTQFLYFLVVMTLLVL